MTEQELIALIPNYPFEDGNILTYNDVNNICGAFLNTSTESGGVQIVDKPFSIEYSELVELRDTSGLTPGMQYRLTNYECTVTNEYDSKEEDGTITYIPYPYAMASNSGHFDIILVADDETTLNENVRFTHNEDDEYFKNTKLESWEGKYCLDNNTDKYDWADPTYGKGVIYWLKDEWNNECPYDFKNMSVRPYIFNDDGTFAYEYTYTFEYNYSDASLYGIAKNNVISKQLANIEDTVTKNTIPGNVFYNKCYNNYIEYNSTDNIIYESTHILLNNNCSSNTINSGCENITLSNAESHMNINSKKKHEIFNNSKYYSYNNDRVNYFILTHESVDNYLPTTGIQVQETTGVTKQLTINSNNGNTYAINDVAYSNETNQVKTDINLTANGISGNIATKINWIRVSNKNLGLEEGSDSFNGTGYLSSGKLTVRLYVKLNNTLIGESNDVILNYDRKIVRDTNTDKQIINTGVTFTITSKTNNINFKRGDTINIEYQIYTSDYDSIGSSYIIDPSNSSKKIYCIAGEIITKNLSVTSKNLTLKYTQDTKITPITSKLIIIANDGVLVRGLNGRYCLIKQTDTGVDLNIVGNVNVDGTLKVNGNSVSVINTPLPSV